MSDEPVNQMDAAFKYDVAFSFVSEDEELASKLNALFRGRISTFIYSEHQERLAGRDGEKVFNAVFGKEARTVVIFYRQHWGSTSWTRIEETAIRNRGFDEGYDFALVIPMDAPASVPKWIPKNRIWIGLERWGLDAAAGVIEARVQEAGGAPREETVEDRAARLRRDMQLAKTRQQYLGSERAADDAKSAVGDLYSQIKQTCGAISDESTNLTFKIEADEANCVVYSHMHTLRIRFHREWANSLDGSRLYVELWKGGIGLRSRLSSFDNPRKIRDVEFSVDFRPDSATLGWREVREGSEFLLNGQLADWCIDQLLEVIRAQRLK